MHYGQLRRRGRIDESSVEAAADSSPLSMEQRLIEIKKRHELLKREIANIHKALESETDDDSSSS
jgi:phage terminase Nu1 subunit (DNA packaging protein)